ncbi:MAG: PLD nuclease N-terminal domain-containing protein [Nanoarchaeota archaeon]|nr:PLD nuclease N-terminal domain-containing protein [Nanoarchaeota archaeon]
MKKIILGLIVALFVINFVAATPTESLQQYYEADKNENIEGMLALTDFSNVDLDFKEETRKSLVALAEIFDTKYYEITDEQEYISGTDALVYYHLETELEDNSGKSAVIEEDFVAVMVNNGGWKLVYMQLKNAFEQNMMLRQATISMGDDYIPEIDFSGTDEGTSEGSSSDESQTQDMIFGLIAIAFMLLFVFAIWMFFDCIFRKNISKKFLWLLGLLIFWVIVPIIYFFTARKNSKNMNKK